MAQKNVMTFSALSKKGVAVWGTRMIDMNDHQIVEAARQDLSLGDTSKVKSNLMLPTEGTRQVPSHGVPPTQASYPKTGS